MASIHHGWHVANIFSGFASPLTPRAAPAYARQPGDMFVYNPKNLPFSDIEKKRLQANSVKSW
jgi:hypothetical protein